MRSNPRLQAGFTIIELIVVIVILGILAATALPRFVDIGEDAKIAATKGVAGAAGSAMTLNYSGCSVVNHAAAANPTKCVVVDACADVGSLMQGGLPAGYSVALKTGGGTESATNGSTWICEVTNTATPSIKAEFTAISAGD